MYENIKRQTFQKADADVYERIGADMDLQMDKLGLSLEQTEILAKCRYLYFFTYFSEEFLQRSVSLFMT